MANPLLDQADELLKLAVNGEKRGLYILAVMRYSQVWTTLLNLISLREAGMIELLPRDEARLAAQLATRLQMVVAKMTNGTKLSGRDEADSPDMAARTLLKEVLEGL
jgi:hypothetical protein